MDRKINKFDLFFIDLINNKLKNPILDRIMPIITNIGGVICTTAFIFILLVKTNFSLHGVGFEVLVGIMITQSIVYGLKALLGRERPYKILEKIHTYGFELMDYSFPSGHTSSSFLISIILSYNQPRFAIVFLLAAFLISVSRIYLGVHYPTDVLAGFFIGFIAAIIVHNYLLDNLIGWLISLGI